MENDEWMKWARNRRDFNAGVSKMERMENSRKTVGWGNGRGGNEKPVLNQIISWHCISHSLKISTKHESVRFNGPWAGWLVRQRTTRNVQRRGLDSEVKWSEQLNRWRAMFASTFSDRMRRRRRRLLRYFEHVALENRFTAYSKERR